MKQQNVYTEVHIDTQTPEQRKNIIQSRWVLRNKGTEVRARIVAKGFTEPVTDIDNIYASTPIYSVLRTTSNTESEQQLDSTNRRHFGSIPTRSSSNRRSLHASTNRVLQQSRRNRLEAQQSNLRLEKLTKSMANTLSRRTTAACSTAVNSRTQHLLHAAAQRLHPGLRGRSTSSWRRGNSQQDLRGDPTTPSTSTNRNFDSGKHSVLSRTQHHQQRRLLRTLDWQIATTTHFLRKQRWRNCKPATAPGTAALKTPTADHDQPLSEDEHKAFRRAVGKTTVDDIHKTRHLLRNKRTCTSIAAANIIGPAEAQTSTTIHQRNNTLQTNYTTNG